MANGKPPKVPARETYAKLKVRVKSALFGAQRQMESSRVEGYWEAGRFIATYLLTHQERAGYGLKTISKLARDLETHHSLLYRCVQFARKFPIFAARRKLTWAHYRALIRIEDRTERQVLEAEAVRRGWTSRQMAAVVARRLAAENQQTTGEGGEASATESGVSESQLLSPKRGAVGVYQIVASGNSLAVDVGFTSFLDLAADQCRNLKGGELVRLDPRGRAVPAQDATKADLFTYEAEVLRVVDGDTLWMKIFLEPPRWLKEGAGSVEPRRWLKEKLRLRGLDAPELITKEGKAAKRYVEALVGKAAGVTITSTKPDKYDRYLSDVYLTIPPLAEDIFLNNALLANAHAVRKDAWEFEDWE